MKKKLSIKFSKSVVDSLSRRHNGSQKTQKEILFGIVDMELLFRKYKKVSNKLIYCLDIWWIEKKIERYFKTSKWYYAHRKLKKLEKEKKELHKKMFYLLLNFDGNYEEFSESESITATEIFNDFKRKYKITNN